MVVGEKHEPEELAGGRSRHGHIRKPRSRGFHWGITQKEYRFVSGGNGALLLKCNRHE